MMIIYISYTSTFDKWSLIDCLFCFSSLPVPQYHCWFWHHDIIATLIASLQALQTHCQCQHNCQHWCHNVVTNSLSQKQVCLSYITYVITLRGIYGGCMSICVQYTSSLHQQCYQEDCTYITQIH